MTHAFVLSGRKEKQDVKLKRRQLRLWKEKGGELGKHEESILVYRLTPRKHVLNTINLH